MQEESQDNPAAPANPDTMSGDPAEPFQPNPEAPPESFPDNPPQPTPDAPNGDDDADEEADNE